MASLFTGMLCLCGGCLQLYAQSFSEVAFSLGADHSYGFGTHGGGVSFADFNRDGWDDLTFTSAAGKPMYFYQNNGGNSFTPLNLVDNTLETKDATWIDYDNDGDRDLFITAFGGTNRLYQNMGNLNMVEVTQTAFGNMPVADTYGAVWGDYDNDGWLDLYICNYSVPGGTSIENDLYRSNGDGTFTRVTSSSGTGNGFTLTFDACFVDLDDNGWQDLYLVNDKFYQPNALYMNTSGNFTTDPSSGAFINIDAMNAGGADYDDDGEFDLYVTNTPTGNQLLENDGQGQFFDVAAGTGTGVYRNCWSATFLDYDLDQDQDLYVSVDGDISFNNPNAFLINFSELGLNVFSEPLQFTGGIGGTDYGQNFGHAIGDFNNDGLPDIAINRMWPDSVRLWQNQETTSGSWLKVDLFGTISNSEGIGARVEVDIDNKTISRYRHGGQGYLSQHSHFLHFGLGSVTQIDQMRVYWPSGTIDVFDGSFEYSQIVILRIDQLENDFTIGALSPNPATDFVDVRFRLPNSGLVFIQVYNLKGELLLQYQIDGEAGENKYRIALEDLAIRSQPLLVRLEYRGQDRATLISIR
ncbi:MAG: FG-GAP-like repeat-containing protein [Bacteroidota bacterium]